MAIDKKAVEAIFDEAIRFESFAKRDAYVFRACGDDQKLLMRIQKLLKHHDSSSFLDAPIFEPNITLDESPISEGPGTLIGRYKLLEKIGEGGMAVVYMAEQETPIRRKVALKIIKLGMDTKSVIARFEAERQALAMMDHPSIAKVLDAGATETGRPYFVMELVQGVSITEYCDKNRISIKERLKLFSSVCNAVQHAHQKGIIHRDIKPSNIMITLHDGKTVPKVIDFGIAKSINQKLTEKTLFTRYAHIIGTPAYMSPEQAELSNLDIDTRTDIYSLGVLLYELLTGITPFGEEELRKAGYIEMQRIIREQEPTKPSTKLSTLGQTLTDIAKHRSATSEVLRKAIRGDLDWIVIKCLEKDRTRRYTTAHELTADIEHHLRYEPIVARCPGVVYRLRKFLRRHRIAALGVLAMVLFTTATIALLSLWNRDRVQLAQAEGFRDRSILFQARQQYAKGDPNAAIETAVLTFESQHLGPKAQLLHAGILVEERCFEEAMTLLEDLINDRPEIAGAAHALMARILREIASPSGEKLQEIEEHRKQAEALFPETAEAYFLRAMIAGTVREQLAALDKVLQLDPAYSEARRLRAYTYHAARKYDRATVSMDDPIMLAPSKYTWTGAADGFNWETTGNWQSSGSIYAWPNEEFGFPRINQGCGEITIANGDAVTCAGELDITGAKNGSREAVLRIDTHSSLIVSTHVAIGRGTHGRGRVEVLNGSSLRVNGTLPQVNGLSIGQGDASLGVLKVVDAALEIHPELSVGGYGAGSTGTMEARNSVVTVGGPLYVGRSDTAAGVLEIKDSLVKAAGDIALGYGPKTTGRLAIEGGTLELEKSSLMLIGRRGKGTLEIKGGNLIAYGLNLCDAGAFVRMVIKDGTTVSLEREVRMIRAGGLAGELVMDGGVVNVSEMTNVNHAGGVGSRADFKLNGGTWKTGIGLNVGNTSNGGDAFLTINGGTMVVGNEVGIGLPGSGRSRIFLNGGLLQCESLAFKDPSADSLIVYRGGELRVNSSAANEAAIQALITAGKIDAPADYQITTIGDYTVLRCSGMQAEPHSSANTDSFLSAPASSGPGPDKELPVK